MKTAKGDTELPISLSAVLSNDDLLTEILLKLPILSLLLFKYVSKRWLSLTTSAIFIMHRSRIPNMDSPCGIFAVNPFDSDRVKFVQLDNRIPAGTSRFKTMSKLLRSNCFEIQQSCNGLLLCYLGSDKYCVYNPSINLFKMLPQRRQYDFGPGKINWWVMKMAFDPLKSPDYKVVYASVGSSIEVQTYSSETRNWSSSICSIGYPTQRFSGFNDNVIYWNDAIHGLNISEYKALHYKLDVVNEVPSLTKIRLPLSPVVGKLFEGRGCLLFLSMDYNKVHQLNIYEMSNGCLEWSLKYSLFFGHINGILGDRMMFSRIWRIVLGEEKEDSFMVIKLNKKVVQYNLATNISRDLCEARVFCPKYSFLFTASFANV